MTEQEEFPIHRIGNYTRYLPIYKFLVYETKCRDDRHAKDVFILTFGGSKTVRASILRSERTRQVELSPGVFLTELDFFEVLEDSDGGDRCLALDAARFCMTQFEIKVSYEKLAMLIPTVIPSTRMFARCGPQRDLFSDNANANVIIQQHVMFYNEQRQHYACIQYRPSSVDVHDHGSIRADLPINFRTLRNLTDGDYISCTVAAHDVHFVLSRFHAKYTERFFTSCEGQNPIILFVSGDTRHESTTEKIARWITYFDETRKTLTAQHRELTRSDQTRQFMILIGKPETRPVRQVLKI